tara:strand:- start:7961 stop:8149 length:189 start_codon:yes stop_codon:yes gene_type:complete
MQKKVVHEVKLQKSVIVILGVIALGIVGIAFKDAITPAWALSNYDNLTLEVTTPGYFDVRMH